MVGLSVGAEDERAVSLLGLGLPIEKAEYDYSFLARVEKPVLVIQGEDDQFGSGAAAAELLRPMRSHVTLVRIAGADHFFVERLDELRETVRGYYQSGPGARVLAAL